MEFIVYEEEGALGVITISREKALNALNSQVLDELDATLHPSLQIELCALLRKYAADYKIQVICTTHSLALLEDVLTKGDKVLYFIDDFNRS